MEKKVLWIWQKKVCYKILNSAKNIFFGLRIYLKVSVNDVINLKIFIIITPRIEQSLGYLDPTKVSNKFNDGEDWDVGDWKKYFISIQEILNLFWEFVGKEHCILIP